MAPTESRGSVMLSSPLYTSKPAGAWATRWAVVGGSPAASLRATMLDTSRASRNMVCGLDPAPGADGDVVEHDGQVARGLGHHPEVLEDARLRRPVVVRRHHEHAVEAALGGPLRQGDGVRGVVGPGPGHDRHGHRLGHGAPEVDLLVVGEDRALARRSGEDQAVASVGRQPARQLHRAPPRSSAPRSSNGVTIAVITRPNRGASSQGAHCPFRLPVTTSALRRPGARRETRRRRRPRPRWSRSGARRRSHPFR